MSAHKLTSATKETSKRVRYEDFEGERRGQPVHSPEMRVPNYRTPKREGIDDKLYWNERSGGKGRYYEEGRHVVPEMFEGRGRSWEERYQIPEYNEFPPHSFGYGNNYGGPTYPPNYPPTMPNRGPLRYEERPLYSPAPYSKGRDYQQFERGYRGEENGMKYREFDREYDPKYPVYNPRPASDFQYEYQANARQPYQPYQTQYQGYQGYGGYGRPGPPPPYCQYDSPRKGYAQPPFEPQFNYHHQHQQPLPLGYKGETIPPSRELPYPNEYPWNEAFRTPFIAQSQSQLIRSPPPTNKYYKSDNSYRESYNRLDRSGGRHNVRREVSAGRVREEMPRWK